MVHLPTRKCVHVLKVSVVLLLVASILMLIERYRGGKRTAGAHQLTDDELEFERQILEDEARIVPGLGEGGVAAHLTGEEAKLGEASEKKLALNVYLSDRIAYNRTLTDHRNPACQRLIYDAELPSASVIIIFHNEPYSVVIRTIWSVLNSARRDRLWYQQANFIERGTGRKMTLGYPGQDPDSPFVYLKEIILVDDNSTLPELKGKLSHYVRTRLPPDMIRILRLPERGGVTQARHEGSKLAVGETMIFLDSQCEANQDWLRPLLQRSKEQMTAVLVPIIDIIHKGTFAYLTQQNFPGLMLARIRGARSARGDVLIFLDAHCEADADWLRPLLQRIRHKRDAVLTPLIDVIDQSTFQLQAAEEFQVGGFTFLGHFTWIDVPDRERKRRGSDIGATWSPTMAGGLFAINRAYYWELGAYDEQMAGWGGENLEMSFRIWQCGGTLETIPCSRVGHVFRAFHPYGLPASSDTHGINTARMAEVWMDDYKELFYLHRPDLRNNPKIGDVTHRKVLREKLHCKNFDWYLRNIYKEKFVPVRDAYGYGRFRNPASNLCLDTLQREGTSVRLGVYPCHNSLQGTQYLTLTLDGVLRDEERCVHTQYSRDEVGSKNAKRYLVFVNCDDKSNGQKWRYTPTKQIVHVSSGLCLDAGMEGGADVLAVKCESTATQKWDIDYNERNGFRLSDSQEPSEAEIALAKIRGQRRISRSLMSYEDTANDTSKMRRHSHKKKHRKQGSKIKRARSRPRTKNKFILKLIRTLPNHTEEHLEVDIYCKHKKLYPNNGFVRDIVTVLNEHNVKVINNGRVFTKHRVTQLVKDPKTMNLRVGKVLEKLELPHHQDGRNDMRSPVDVTAQQQAAVKPVEPNTAQQWQKKTKGKKLPVQILTTGSNAQNQDAYNVPNVLSDKKIIIEDFVEIKPDGTLAPQQRSKNKRKHPTPRASLSTERSPMQPARPKLPQMRTRVLSYDNTRDDGHENRQHTTEKAQPSVISMEEVAMVSQEQEVRSEAVNTTQSKTIPAAFESRYRYDHGSDRDTDSDNADQSIDYSSNRTLHLLRRYEDEVTTRSPHSTEGSDDSDSDVQTEAKTSQPTTENYTKANKTALRSTSGHNDGAPLKVVMRSNLTFNLGNEFFKWRAKDDVAELLDELAIPTTTNESERPAPPMQAWVKPSTHGRHNDDISSEEDTQILTGGGANKVAHNKDQSDLSSSEER